MKHRKLTTKLATAFLLMPSLFITSNASASPSSTNPPQEPDCIVCGVPQRQIEVLSGPERVEAKHVRYLTSAWTKANSYTWSESVTVGSSVSANISLSADTVSSQIGTTVSVNKSWGVAVTLPADSTRASKLELKSAFEKRTVKVKTTQNGKVLSQDEGDHYSPIEGEQYVEIAYQ